MYKLAKLSGGRVTDSFGTLLPAIKYKRLPITTCYGQSDDGATTITGLISGLRTKNRGLLKTHSLHNVCANFTVDAVISNV